MPHHELEHSSVLRPASQPDAALTTELSLPQVAFGFTSSVHFTEIERKPFFFFFFFLLFFLVANTFLSVSDEYRRPLKEAEECGFKFV